VSVQTSKARFEVCEACGLHGRLIDDAGNSGPEIGSKHLAQFALAVAVEKGRVDAALTEDIAYQIDGSRLPPTDEEADPSLLYKIMHWNENLLGRGVRHGLFHETLNN
jgi:hypothetical protein